MQRLHGLKIVSGVFEHTPFPNFVRNKFTVSQDTEDAGVENLTRNHDVSKQRNTDKASNASSFFASRLPVLLSSSSEGQPGASRAIEF